MKMPFTRFFSFGLFFLLSQSILAKPSEETQLRASLQTQFNELHLQGETSICAPTKPNLEKTAKVLAFEETSQLKDLTSSGNNYCATLTLSGVQPPKEITQSGEFFSDLAALHHGNGVRLCAKINEPPSLEIGQQLTKKLGVIARTLSLGESVVAEIQTEPETPGKPKHRRARSQEHTDQTLCALVRLKHFDPRHPSLAFEHFQAVYEGTGRADASLSF